ncbi:hypothetical protein P1X14_11545 [Sphingomonas sp. AOB5]|uniref:hypothetical protein n=1 Tax=Sphingomonas sp. AOB5 TaxID=3034017 RepID=UPI0023F705AE|nr:hypothetical protein [Sphingomonas sp. AOB5]MDF7775882.1 hypothetical protein [Sphingomonas sp. AOB5]
MRGFLLVAPVALILAGCNAADRSNIGNAVENAGTEIGNGAADIVEGAGNVLEDAGNAVTILPPSRDDWVGRWTGVEGTYLVVSKGATAGSYKLEMQYTLDDKGIFDGTGSDAGIAFTRPDGKQELRASNGDATGLKYLAGKKDCLKVKDGEGYCRD